MILQPDIPTHVHTLEDMIRWGVKIFEEARLIFGHGTDNPWDEAALLVFHVLGLPLENTYQNLQQAITEQQKRAARDLLWRRIVERKPAPYLIRQAWFAGHSFYVDERVLIPRSPIAELIETKLQPWVQPPRVRRLLDLGTGSGCIGIACAHAFPDAHIDVSDLSLDALEIATENIQRHALQDRVTAIQSDLFDNLRGRCYDVILSNPPYVDADTLAMVPPEYKHEPEIALAAGQDGLDLVFRVLQQAADHLNPEGVLIVEVGNSEVGLVEWFPKVPFIWFEFERGGHGVFLLTAEQCAEHF